MKKTSKKTSKKTAVKKASAKNKVVELAKYLKKTPPERPTAKEEVAAEPGAMVLAPPALPRGAIETHAAVIGIEAKVSTLQLTADTMPQAREMLVQLKAHLTKLEEVRTFFVAPLNQHVKSINNLFRPLTEKAEHVRAALNQKVLRFQNEAEAAVEAAKRELTEQAIKANEEGDVNAAAELASTAATLQAETARGASAMGSVTVQRPWQWKVVDLALIPREYLTLNERAINQAMRAGLRDIPGIEFFQEARLAVSALAPDRGDVQDVEFKVADAPVVS